MLEFKTLIEKHLNKYYGYLNNTRLKTDLYEYLKGYTFKSTDPNFGEFFLFKNNNSNITVYIEENGIRIKKISNTIFEEVLLYQPLSSYRTVEKNENGIIYSTIHKQFYPGTTFGEIEDSLISLNERKYFFSKDSLNKLNEVCLNDNSSLITYFLDKSYIPNLYDICDYISEFATYLDAKKNLVVLLNKVDISYMFDIKTSVEEAYNSYKNELLIPNYNEGLKLRKFLSKTKKDE